ncbi:hypothetical protein [Spirosoma spitsbergense]|jgi:hypothetical protein|uniref:hypothetical protein n=1 Tax=Spirosoma spitsbergense TaxID=431554 RepID=UPI000366C02F|nr:hypothetical protein [Spirosoma spitsbergense]
MEKQGKDAIDMDESNREDIIRAKQAISPDGLEDQSVEGNSGVGSEVITKKLPPDELEDKYMDGDETAANVRVNNPNRNPDSKPDIDKPAYS